MLKIYKVDRGKVPVTGTNLNPHKFGMTLEHDYYISGNKDNAFIDSEYVNNTNNMTYFLKKLREVMKIEGFQFSEDQLQYRRNHI